MVNLNSRTLFGVVAVLMMVGCGGDDETDSNGGKAGKGGSAGTAGRGADGSAASGGAGQVGSSGAAGALGSTGASGAAGSGASGSAGIGSGGDAGSAAGGSAGTAAAGSAGTAGGNVGGTAGTPGGTGGTAGTAGDSGDASAGSAGSDAGSQGSAGQDGSADSSVGGSAGSAGSSGSAGSASGGTSGVSNDASADSGGSAGSDAGAQCDDPSDCDNGIYCDGAEQCQNGACVAGTPVVCAADGFACTQEICSESSKACASVPQASNCDDGAFCNGAELCAPTAGNADARGCTPGVAPTCNDGITCTTDSCSNTTRACIFTPVHQQCSDGLYCTGTETCAPGNPAAVNGCVAGVPVDCEDGIACTADSCSNATSSCTHVPNHLSCTDGLPCNGIEQCDATPGTGGCKAGTPVVCNTDGIQCTVEACDQATGTCDVTLDNARCPSGQTCTIGGCTSGRTCPGGTNAECQDGNLCNGPEVCVTGICRPGTAVNCNDSIDCTVDDCNPSTGQCSHAPASGFCDDRDPCNGVETCDATPGTGGCKTGTALTCNDGIACTSDSCVFGLGCDYTPVNSACQDNLICNGVEICDPTPVTGGCKAGPAVSCQSDGIACTQESCVEPLGCVSKPNNALCPCGQTCDATQGGCGNFCRISLCSSKLYQCGDCIDNDADCKIDSADEHCTGVCDNTENHLYPNLPGAPGGPCKLDCFFDNGNGSGNDDCYWDHKCDPLEVAPNYPPEGASCSYDPTSRPGPGLSCQQALTAQSSLCTSFCGPLVPNGCDCFGCCAIPGAPTTVWLGSQDGSDNGTCTLGALADPTKCKPCTQVPACLNTCDRCEICLGKPTIPADCNGQTCPPGRQACGLPGQAQCPEGQFCVTGCCQNNPGGG